MFFLVEKNTPIVYQKIITPNNKLPNKPNPPYYNGETYYLKEVSLEDEISILTLT